MLVIERVKIDSLIAVDARFGQGIAAGDKDRACADYGPVFC